MSMFVEFLNQPENFLDKWRDKIINEVTNEGPLSANILAPSL